MEINSSLYGFDMLVLPVDKISNSAYSITQKSRGFQTVSRFVKKKKGHRSKCRNDPSGKSMIAHAAVLIFPAAMAAAVMTALVVMVCTDGIRVIEQCAVQQRINRRVRAAGNTGIQLDARFCKRRARTAADAAADERIHAVLLQKASQCTVAAAICGRDLCIFELRRSQSHRS